jgi:hypothetical protein
MFKATPTTPHGPALPTQRTSSVERSHTTPDNLRPYPKAPPRKLEANKRQKGSTRILTDTPVKTQLAALEHSRKRKKSRGKKAEGEPKAKKTLMLKKSKKHCVDAVEKASTNSLPKPGEMKKNHKETRKAKDSKLEKNKLQRKTKKHCKVKGLDRVVSGDQDDANILCFYCEEETNDAWIRCMECQRWAHDSCAGAEPQDETYICEFCH